MDGRGLTLVDLATGVVTDPVDRTAFRPAALAFAREGELVVALREGVTQVFSASSGRCAATLLALSKTLGVALLADGRAEWIGAPSGGAPAERAPIVCRVGLRVLPFEACEERLVVRGALPSALRGELEYLEP